ncbi:MAG: alpha/beta fold hydrolase [Betaproteobacteria bacterium]|nr:alpha/beta fold hydrolase [Betaproteobacteria bacterium]
MSLLPALELVTNHNPTASVIWLHGLGADGYDFVPIVKELQVPDALPLRFIFPHAPLQPVTVNNGMVMRAWYDVSYDGLERRTDDNGVLRSAAAVEALVAREIARGIPPRRIVLAGFSQGGAVALTLGTRFGKRLGGIMALSTYLPMLDELSGAASPENRDIPIFMAHGIQDNVIPLNMAEASRTRLSELDYPVEWHTYPMAHSLCMEEVEAISAWLQQNLAP